MPATDRDVLSDSRRDRLQPASFQPLCTNMKSPSIILATALASMWALASGLAGCSTAGPSADAPGQAVMVFVILKSGPTSGSGDKDQRARMFQGHMANIKRLADERQLLIAGPFAKPADPTWRGLLLLDVETVDKAQALASTDPGVQAGEFVADARPLRASVTLRQTAELERQMFAEQVGQPADPTKPTANIRPYVMLTSENFDTAMAAVSASGLGSKVVWEGRFEGTRGGVIVLDVQKPEEVRALLPAGAAITIDGWWSTASLTRLPNPVREPTETPGGR